MNSLAKQRGFTLVEIMVTLAIMGVLLGAAFPVYLAYQNRNNLSLATGQVVSMLRRAQVYARGSNGDSTWGVALQPGSAVLYKGASYAARDTAYDETISLPTNITRSGLAEVNFAKMTAVPSASGVITLTTGENDSKAITLNAEGMVAY